MINEKNNRVRNGALAFKAGSSLVVVLLIMSVLLTLTIGVSNLVIKEIRQTSDLVASGQAYYAAEAGIESALYDLSEGLPGYETIGVVGADDDGWVEIGKGGKGLQFNYKIANKGDKIPYFPEEEPIFLPDGGAFTRDLLYTQMPEETYNVLGLNESVTIPLFTADEDGGYEDVKDFLVQYYVDFDIDSDVKKQLGTAGVLQNFDVMRWKVFGNPGTKAQSNVYFLKTDAISDFYPAMEGDGAGNPVCIGSDTALFSEALSDIGGDSGNNCGYGNYCQFPTTSVFLGQGTQPKQLWSFARECYKNEVTTTAGVGNQKGDTDVYEDCSISGFIGNHSRNYVTLTNIVNPGIVGKDPLTQVEDMNIYYRVIAKPGADNPKLVRESADIKADGFASDGKVKQSIDVKLKSSSFLPVFNFSLYRTKTNGGKDSPTTSNIGN